MPQLVKGGKWVFGWAVVGEGRRVRIPEDACEEYGFRVGDEAICLPGSRTSGGFSLARKEKIKKSKIRAEDRMLGFCIIEDNGEFVVPQEAGTAPGTRLLAVRGSGLALGFIEKGQIYETAVDHPGIEDFMPSRP